MSKLDSKKTMPRYLLIVIVMILVAIAVVAKASYTMTVKHDYWMDVIDRVKFDSLTVEPKRGDIYSSDGALMATSMPDYKMFMDFRSMTDVLGDTTWTMYEDSICMGLHEIFPQQSVEEFREHLRKGLQKQSRHYPVWKYRVDYATYSETKRLPVFREKPNRGGFHVETFEARKHPNGSAGARVIGRLYSAKDSAYCGIELAYDSLLRGTPGWMHRRKTLSRFLNIVDQPAIDGADIVTTIDVDIQDLAERALLEELKLPEVNGQMGVAIVMEVATGDIKAMVNMQKGEDGQYHEVINNAISYTCEPGSVFKPASILVALDDGVVDTSYVIHTGGGIMEMHGRHMKDHNWTKGGYKDINVARSLEVSSNIGVSYVIDHFYRANPEKFVQGLERIGMREDLKLPLLGYHKPRIDMPRKDKYGHWANWDATKLPWMSIGYNTQIAPINTVTFYNAIANNGKMMRPRFVKQVVKDGEVIMDFPPEVIKEHIAKDTSIKTLQTVLRHVVSQGLGKKAGSKSFQVSGKTGTAQVADGHGSYKSGTMRYWLSFAGYFPSDNPRYSCIICIKKSGLPASGGGMSGVVFHNIAEGIMAKDVKQELSSAREDNLVIMPEVKRGNILAADFVLRNLGLTTDSDLSGVQASAMPVWGKGEAIGSSKVTLRKEATSSTAYVPDVKGMGARDAVYLLESRGLKVKIEGCGKVHQQSLLPGTRINKGQRCDLFLRQ